MRLLSPLYKVFSESSSMVSQQGGSRNSRSESQVKRQHTSFIPFSRECDVLHTDSGWIVLTIIFSSSLPSCPMASTSCTYFTYCSLKCTTLGTPLGICDNAEHEPNECPTSVERSPTACWELLPGRFQRGPIWHKNQLSLFHKAFTVKIQCRSGS